MTVRMEADLHTHTTASDGTQRPAANVQMAFDAGLGAIAITDHDTVSGVAEALAAGVSSVLRLCQGLKFQRLRMVRTSMCWVIILTLIMNNFCRDLASLREHERYPQ